MAKKLSEQQIAELEELKEWCSTIVNYILQRGGGGFVRAFLPIVDKSYEKQSLSALRSLQRDINEMASGLSLVDRANLNDQLQKRFGKSLNTQNEKDIIRVQKIVSNGKIKNASEYRLVMQRVEAIYLDQNYASELDVLNRLLADFHKK